MNLVLHVIVLNIYFMAMSKGDENELIDPPDFSGMLCDPCEANRRCKLTRTGHTCMFESDLNAIANYTSDTANPSYLQKCLPRGNFLQQRINSLCCVWSPKIGCTMLKNNMVGNEIDCTYCATLEEIDGKLVKSYCPCEGTCSLRSVHTLVLILALIIIE